MFFLYNLLMILFTIFCSFFIAIAFICVPKFRAGFFQKLGLYKKFDAKGKETIAFHAVSVGEVNAIENLVKKVRQKMPENNIVLTTVTKTGHDVAKKKLSNCTDAIVYFPYDFSFSVLSFLKNFKVSKLVIAETEIWPNVVNLSKKLGVEVIIANGRISPSSFKGYKKIKFFIKNVLKKYDKMMMQTEDDVKRIIELGAKPQNVCKMGNLKFDIEKNLTEQQIEVLKSQFKVGENQIFIASSTHEGEDQIAINLFKKLKSELSNLKMIIAPRHPERWAGVFDLVRKNNLTCGKRSLNQNFENFDVIELDTMGELAKIYAISSFAFIGGSFSNTGGHNPLEATIWQKPAISGPSVFNFKDIYKILTQNQAAFVVENEKELFDVALNLARDKKEYLKCVQNCNKIFETNKGALNFALEQIAK